MQREEGDEVRKEGEEEGETANQRHSEGRPQLRHSKHSHEGCSQSLGEEQLTVPEVDVVAEEGGEGRVQWLVQLQTRGILCQPVYQLIFLYRLPSYRVELLDEDIHMGPEGVEQKWPIQDIE